MLEKHGNKYIRNYAGNPASKIQLDRTCDQVTEMIKGLEGTLVEAII